MVFPNTLLIRWCWHSSFPCTQEVFQWKLQKIFRSTSVTAMCCCFLFFPLSSLILYYSESLHENETFFIWRVHLSLVTVPHLKALIMSTTAVCSVSHRGLWLQVGNKQWEQMESQETQIPFSCKSVSKREKRKYIQCKHSFSETLWSRSQRHKSQKFQQ